MRWRLTADSGLDGVDFADPAQCFYCQRRAVGLGNFVNLAPCTGPPGRKNDVAAASQPLKAGIAIDVQNALKMREMRGGTLGLSIRRKQVNCCRRCRSAPSALIAGLDPQSPFLVRPRPGSSTEIGRASCRE